MSQDLPAPPSHSLPPAPFTSPVSILLLCSLFLILTGLRFFLSISFPLPVSGDEAYYWDWGRQLSWGYYSKPPLIGWLMAAAEALIGGEIGIRIFAAAFASLGLASWTAFAYAAFGSRTAFWSLLLLALSPASVALGLLLTIDAPLFAFTSLSVFFAYQILHRPSPAYPSPSALAIPPSVSWFCLVLFLGASHLTKQIAWFLPPLLAVAALAAGFYQRKRFLQFALASFLSYLALLPTVLWNALNGWPLLGHTLSHLATNPVSIGRQAARFFEFLGSQFGLISPLTAGLIVATAIYTLPRLPKLQPALRFLWVLAFPGLIVFLLLALRQRVLPNWPLVFYPPAIVALAACLTLHQKWIKWSRPAVITGAVFAFLTAVLPLLITTTGLEKSRLDPLKRLRGWPDYAAVVSDFNAGLSDGPLPLIVYGHRYYVAQLAFYGSGNPQVLRWSNREIVDSQYELWPIPAATLAGPSLLVIPQADASLPPEVAASFSGVTPLGSHSYPDDSGVGSGLSFFRVVGWGASAPSSNNIAPKSP